jgi:predicted nucleic acid-binding protein
MTRFLLDTSAYSLFMRGHRDVQAFLQQADEIFFNPVIIGELKAGFIKGGNPRKHEAELRSFLESPRARLIPIDEETADCYAVILNGLWRAGTPVPTNDLWIAASAMQHGLKVLTADGHYLKIPQVIAEYLQPPV